MPTLLCWTWPGPGACLSSEQSPGGGCAGPWNAGWGSGGLGCEGPCSWGPPSGWKTGAPGSGTPCGGLRPGLCPSRGWVMRLMVPMRTWSGLLEDGGGVGLQFPAVCAEKPELRLLLGGCGGQGGWGGVRDCGGGGRAGSQLNDGVHARDRFLRFLLTAASVTESGEGAGHSASSDSSPPRQCVCGNPADLMQARLVEAHAPLGGHTPKGPTEASVVSIRNVSNTLSRIIANMTVHELTAERKGGRRGRPSVLDSPQTPCPPNIRL